MNFPVLLTVEEERLQRTREQLLSVLYSFVLLITHYYEFNSDWLSGDQPTPATWHGANSLRSPVTSAVFAKLLCRCRQASFGLLTSRGNVWDKGKIPSLYNELMEVSIFTWVYGQRPAIRSAKWVYMYYAADLRVRVRNWTANGAHVRTETFF